MTFYEYMMYRINEDNPIGDLARDMSEDPKLPRNETPLDMVRYFMLNRNLCDSARRALRDAWREYREFDQIECRVRIALQECREKCLGDNTLSFPDISIEKLAAQTTFSILDVR